MTNMQPIPQVPGNNDDLGAADKDIDALGDDTDDVDRPLDPDTDDNQVDSATADQQAATEGTLPSDTDR